MFLNLSSCQIIGFTGPGSPFSFTSLLIIMSAFSCFPFASLSCGLLQARVKWRRCFKLYKHQSWKHKLWQQCLREMVLHLQIQSFHGDVKCSFAGVRNTQKNGCCHCCLFLKRRINGHHKIISAIIFDSLLFCICACYSKAKHEQLWRIISMIGRHPVLLFVITLLTMCSLYPLLTVQRALARER